MFCFSTSLFVWISFATIVIHKREMKINLQIHIYSDPIVSAAISFSMKHEYDFEFDRMKFLFLFTAN